jgi:hypothetical protein
MCHVVYFSEYPFSGFKWALAIEDLLVCYNEGIENVIFFIPYLFSSLYQPFWICRYIFENIQ